MAKYIEISSERKWYDFELHELFSYRHLILVLGLRDLKVQYAQTYIGLLWAVIKPIFTILILSFVFGTVADVGTGNTNSPHILYTAVGLCAWTFFASLFNGASNSIIMSQNMVKKIYFPRLILPLSKAIIASINFIISLILVLILMFVLDFYPKINLLWTPLYIILIILTGLAGGVWVSALTIRFRDFVHVSPFVLQLGLYATPIAFPIESIPENYRLVMYLNPMTGVVDGFRYCLLGGTFPSHSIIISFTITILFFASGLLYFNSVQYKMADII